MIIKWFQKIWVRAIENRRYDKIQDREKHKQELYITKFYFIYEIYTDTYQWSSYVCLTKRCSKFGTMKCIMNIIHQFHFGHRKIMRLICWYYRRWSKWTRHLKFGNIKFYKRDGKFYSFLVHVIYFSSTWSCELNLSPYSVYVLPRTLINFRMSFDNERRWKIWLIIVEWNENGRYNGTQIKVWQKTKALCSTLFDLILYIKCIFKTQNMHLTRGFYKWSSK